MSSGGSGKDKGYYGKMMMEKMSMVRAPIREGDNNGNDSKRKSRRKKLDK